MYKVQIEDLCLEVDAETAANLEDSIYASKYLRAVSKIEDCEYYEAYDQADTENQPQQTSSKSFRWNHKAALMLLESYREYQSRFETGQSKEGWKMISGNLHESGINVTPQQCLIKIDTLKRRFKCIKDTQFKTGTSPITWEHYSLMAELFEKKSWAEPLKGAISSTLSESKTSQESSEPKPGCSKETQKKKEN